MAGSTYVLEEDLEHATSLLVDQARDTLDTATTGETADGLQQRARSAPAATPLNPSTRQRTGLVIPWMLSRRILR